MVRRYCVTHKRAGRDDDLFAVTLAQCRLDVLSPKNITNDNVVNRSIGVGEEADFRNKKYPAVIPERDCAKVISYRKWLGDVVGSSDNIRDVRLLPENIWQEKRRNSHGSKVHKICP